MCSHCRQSQRRRFVSLSTTRSISISITLRYREFRLCSIDSPLNFFPSIFGRPMFTLSARCTTIFALRLTLFHFFFRFSHFEFAHRFICLELPMTSKCLFEIGKNKNFAARCRSNQRGRFSHRFFFLLYCLL